MSNDSKRSGPVRLDSLAELLEGRHESEAAVLDALIGGLARGHSHPELWELMHAGARRDDRVSEVAFAYETALGEKKVRLLASAAQVELHMHAARFFIDDFSDADGAAPHLERVLALSPGHAEAFERLERYLVDAKEDRRLAEVCMSVAQFRERDEQLRLLGRALQIFAGMTGEEDRALKLGRDVLRLDPSDHVTRGLLEANLVHAGRFAEAAKLLEQALVEVAASDADEAFSLRARLVALYGGKLGEPERALPHAEEVLRVDASHEGARSVLTALLGNKGLAVRAAAALEAAHEKTGDVAEVVRLLSLQVEGLRGAKRVEAQKRLLIALADRVDDAAAAFAVCEAIVPVDPADDAVRQRLLTLAIKLDRSLDAARVVQRANVMTKDAALRARLGADLGELYLAGGDVKKARAAVVGVLDAGTDVGATLRAARALASISTAERDVHGLATALGRLSEIEDQPDARAEAAARLAAICEGDLHDTAAAVAAYRKLFDTPHEDEALAALERLLAKSATAAERAEVLERRSLRTSDRELARSLALRAAETRSEGADDATALGVWRVFADRFGPSRQGHQRLIPLLERAERWEDLALALAADVELAPEPERAALLYRVGRVRRDHVGDALGAVSAFGRVLSKAPGDADCQRAVGALLEAGGETSLAAAEVLEPILRAERVRGGAPEVTRELVRVLLARGSFAPTVRARLDALAEAASLTAGALGEPGTALELAARGLEEAIGAAMFDGLGPWLVRVDAFATAAGDSARRAAVLGHALGDQEIAHPAVVALARRAAEAHLACGAELAALAVYRRLLAFDPRAPDVVDRVDRLLRLHGTPEERASILRAALERETDAAARGQWLCALAAVQRHELGDLPGAIATFRLALAENPSDRDAREALLDAYAAAGSYGEVFDELARALPSAEGAERALLHARMAVAATSAGRLADAAQAYSDALAVPGAELPDTVLDGAERVAELHDAAGLARAVLARRAALAAEGAEQVVLLERLGLLEATRVHDVDAAVRTWKGAAEVAARVGDEAGARRLHERVLDARPDDADSAEALVAAYEREGSSERLLFAYEALVRARACTPAVVDVLLALEGPATRERATDRFLAAVDGALASGGFGVALRSSLFAARARVLAADSSRQDEAAQAFRALVGESADPHEAVLAFEAFLQGCGDAPARLVDRRWLFSWRLDAALPEDRAAALFAWAQAEETPLGDLGAAAELYGRVLSLEPNHDGALAARGRALLALGDAEGALAMVRARHERAEGAVRTALSLEMARLLLDRLDRADEALEILDAAIASTPIDPAAIALAEHALSIASVRDRAAALLERAVEVSDEPTTSRRLLRALLAYPGAPVEARLRRLARLVDLDADDPESALESALAALGELPGEPSLWDRAEALARELNRPQPVATAYRNAIEALASPLDAAAFEELGQRALLFQEEWFDDPETVARMLRRVLAKSPSATWAFDRLKLFYNAAERWDELFALYDEVIAASSAEQQLALLEDAAETARDLAGDVERAVHYLERLVASKRDARITAALERLYERTGRHRSLVELLTRELAELDVEAAQSLRARIAGLWLDAGEAEAACRAVEDLAALEPDRPDVVGLLEQVLLQTASAPEPARARAAALLAVRYRAAGLSPDLARVIEVELETAREPARRASLLGELVSLRVGLGDDPSALGPAAELAVLEPDVPGHLIDLEQLAAQVGRLDVLIDTLVRIADASVERPDRAALYARAAVLLEGPAADLARAAELRRRVLAISKDDAEVLVSARVLEALLASLERSDDRCDVLERIAEVTADATERRRVLAEVARLATVAGDDARAIRAWRSRLERGPEDREAHVGLVEALRRLGRHEELADALVKRAAFATDAAAARRDRSEVARLLAGPLGRRDAAIEAWSRLRDELGPDDESCDALAALLESADRAEELAALLDDALGAAVAAPRRALLARRLGDVHRLHTLDLELAALAYKVALADDPSDELALNGLGSIVEDLTRAARPGAPPPPLLRVAVDALVTVEIERDAWQRTLHLLEPRLLVAADDDARVAMLLDAAALFETRAGDVARAFEATWRAFRLCPSSQTGAEVLRLATVADRWADVAEGLHRALEGERGVPSETARDLFWRVGEWHRDVCLGPDAAEAALTRALGYDPTNARLLASLAELQRRSLGRPLVATLLRLSDATGGDLDLLREAAGVARERVGDRELAQSIAERLLELSAARWTGAEADAESVSAAGSGAPALPSEAAAWALSTLLELADVPIAPAVELAASASIDADLSAPASSPASRERLIALHLRGASLPFGAAEQRRMRLAAAELADDEQAMTLYRALFDEHPEDEAVAARLETLYRKAQRSPDLLTMRARQIALVEGERKAWLLLEVAAIHATFGQQDLAIELLRASLVELPDYEPTAERLAKLLDELGRDLDLTALVEARAKRESEKGDRAGAAERFERAGSLALERLADGARALADFERAADLGSDRALDAVARLRAERGESVAAAAALERLCERGDPPMVASALPRLLASLVGARKYDAARARLDAALAAGVPGGDSLRAGLLSLFRAAEAWGPLAELLAADAAAHPEAEARLALLCEAAALHLGQRADAAAAIPLLEQAVALAPEDRVVGLSLARALRAAGRPADAIGVLRGILASYGARRPKDRANVHHELASALLDAGDRAAALVELELCVRIDPAHAAGLHARARIEVEDGELERAQRTFRALLLVVKAAGSDAGVGRAEVLCELGIISERSGDATRAAEHFDSALELARADASEWAGVFRALREPGHEEDLVRALEARIDAPIALAPGDLSTLLDERAAAEDRVGRSADAFATSLRALEAAPSSAPLHQRAAARAAKLGREQDYVEAVFGIADRIDADGVADAATALHALALGLAEVGASDERVLAMLRRAEARAGEGALAAIQRSLQEIYARTGDHAAEEALLERRLSGFAPDDVAEEHAQIALALASLRLAHSPGIDAGAALIARALHAGASPDRVETVVREALAAAPRSVELVRLLAEIGREHGRPRALLDALVLHVELESDPAARLVALREAAELAERLDERVTLEQLLESAVALSSSAASDDDGRAAVGWALSGLARARERAGDHDAASVLYARAAVVASPSERRALVLSAASATEDAERAAALLEPLVLEEPLDPQAWSALVGALEKLGDVERLASVAERALPTLSDDALRVDRLRHVARAVGIVDPDRAAALLEPSLDGEPERDALAEDLAKLLERGGRDDDLVRLLSERTQVFTARGDAGGAATAGLAFAALLERLGRTDDALSAYQAVLEADPANHDAQRAQIRLDSGRSIDLGTSLARLLATGHSNEAAGLALEMAAARSLAGDEPGSLAALEQGHHACPACAPVRDALVARYEASGSYRELADLHVSSAVAASTAEERVAQLRAGAVVLRDHLGDPSGASALLLDAHLVAHDDRAVLEAFVAACSLAGEHARAASVLATAVERSPRDPALLRLCASLHDAVGDEDLALIELERAYDLSSGRYASELVARLERALSTPEPLTPTGGPSRERGLRLRFAEVLARAGELDRARDELAALLQVDPADSGALHAAAALEEAARRWDAACTFYGRLLPLAEGEALAELALRYANAAEHAGRLGEACEALERAAAFGPQRPAVLQGLRAAHGASLASGGSPNGSVGPSFAFEQSERFAQLVQAGRSALTAPGASADAIGPLEEARHLRPDDDDLVVLLSQAYVAASRRSDADALLTRLAEARAGSRSRAVVSLQRLRAGLARDDGAIDDALAALVAAFASDPYDSALGMELAVAALEHGDADTARRALAAVSHASPLSESRDVDATYALRASARCKLAELVLADGDRERAASLLAQAVSEDPSLEAARSRLAELRSP